MSGKPINLNRVRKARARDEERRKADENSVKYGRTKAERSIEAAKNEQSKEALEAHRLDRDDTK